MTKAVWLVTGASRGLGAAVVAAALEAGRRVVATHRSMDEPRPTSRADLLDLALDVRDAGQAAAVVDATLMRFGRIDVLVNNAGAGLHGMVEEATSAEVEALFQINVFGLLNVTRAVLPVMRRQRSGHIINVSSIGGVSAIAGSGLYGASKFAVEGLSEALALELAPLGIRVTILEPGAFRTEFLSRSVITTTEAIEDYVEARRTLAARRAKLAQGPRGDPDKLARAVLELASMQGPPLRLALGPDAVERVRTKLAAMGAELDAWSDLGCSTDLT